MDSVLGKTPNSIFLNGNEWRSVTADSKFFPSPRLLWSNLPPLHRNVANGIDSFPFNLNALLKNIGNPYLCHPLISRDYPTWLPNLALLGWPNSNDGIEDREFTGRLLCVGWRYSTNPVLYACWGKDLDLILICQWLPRDSWRWSRKTYSPFLLTPSNIIITE
jgi:hypothetical protein